MTRIVAPLPKQFGEFNMPRRACLQAYHPAETAIREAMAAVEVLGADPLLTDAVTKLMDAKNLVADWLEGATRA